MNSFELFDPLLEPVFILNENGEIVYANETAGLIAGLSARKLVRQKTKLDDALNFSETVEWMKNLKDVADPTPYKELRFKNLSGEEGKVQITCQRLSTSPPEEPRWIVFVRDVTLEERLQKKYRGELEQKEGVIEELKKAQAELQNYSKNLESMVEQRTEEVRKLNRELKALLDSLSQGFLIFNSQGDVLPAYSQACLSTLEKNPEKMKIWEVLSLDEPQSELFRKWMSTLFDQLLPFEDLKPLGPESYKHSKDRRISLDYFPIWSLGSSSERSLQGVVLVSTDITELKEAQLRAEQEKKMAGFILDLVQKQSEISRFVVEAQKILEALNHTTSTTDIISHQDQLFRWIHTLKGGSGSFTIGDLAERCHEAEESLTQLKNANSPLHVKKLIQNVNGIQKAFDGFLKQARQILGPKSLSKERYVPVRLGDLYTWVRALNFWSKGKKLSESILNEYIYEPLPNFLQSYNEVMQKLAEKQGKKIKQIEFKGSSLSLPSEVFGSLFGSFVHLFRNIVDHGLETPEERLALGKPEGGQVFVYSSEVHTSSQSFILLEVRDDGRGISAEVIRKKAIERGADAEILSKQSDPEVLQWIFKPQFSTKTEVTDISGRGVGLDAVKDEVEKLGGKIWVESQPKQGTRFLIQWPKTKAKTNQSSAA